MQNEHCQQQTHHKPVQQVPDKVTSNRDDVADRQINRAKYD
jgi:hypothetical protein